MAWLDADGKQYTYDEMVAKLTVLLDKHKGERETQFIVGTDSDVEKLKIKFTTSVCVYWQGLGGFYFYQNVYEAIDPALPQTKKPNGRKSMNASRNKQRIFNEVSLSVEVATALQETMQRTPHIHIDASEEIQKEYTSQFSSQLKGYSVSSGFETHLKPNSWAASSLADKYSK